MKDISLLRTLEYILPSSILLTIYKSFIRPHLDYGDVIYDQPSKPTFSSKINSVQYNAALAITGAIRSSFREKLYQGIRYRGSSSEALDETSMFVLQSSLKYSPEIDLLFNFSYQTPLEPPNSFIHYCSLQE